MSKTAAIPMDKEIQSFLFTFTGQQYKSFYPEATNFYQQCSEDKECRRKHQIIDVQLFNGVALIVFP